MANKIKNLLFFKIFFTIVVVLGLIACKKVQQPALQSNTGRMLQIELKMPEAWKRIVIGPKNAKAYPKVPRTFSMFMTGESAVALKPYLIISSKISQLGQQRPLNSPLAQLLEKPINQGTSRKTLQHATLTWNV